MSVIRPLHSRSPNCLGDQSGNRSPMSCLDSVVSFSQTHWGMHPNSLGARIVVRVYVRDGIVDRTEPHDLEDQFGASPLEMRRARFGHEEGAGFELLHLHRVVALSLGI